MLAITSEKTTMPTHFEKGDPGLDLKSSHTVPVGDYSGAVAKDDPAEVALVRKLD
jgi:hypothetical protein